MYAAERSIVNETLLNDPLCMNIVVGGGGWQPFSGWQNPEYNRKHSEQSKRKISENHVGMSGRNHSIKSRKQMSVSHSHKLPDEWKQNISASLRLRTGAKNSAFGTIWIYKNQQCIRIKKEELDNYLQKGWLRGRKFKEKE